ncbi:MAG: 3-deoxy-8-phosphooctulonate synthase [Candidatus Cloacimonadota bacterium]|nr:MAG: 3-deoxy-8-phosphooctulonate synthase [Candidatus Cloacimonadota bacterium]
MTLYEKLKSEDKFFIIAGPCVLEDEETAFKIAEYLKKETEKRKLAFVFKASYCKANRTSVDSYTGPGLKKGLDILNKIKTKFDVPVLTDIHEINEVKEAAEVVDILQIPAFLSRQTFLLSESARSNKIINIKKAQFMAPEDINSAAQKCVSEGNNQILVTERGSSFGYHNLVVDFRSFPIMKRFGFPVIYDVTHSLQRPSDGKTTGGNPEFAPIMARSAIASGNVDGLFIETHPEPSKAKSDAATMLKLEKLPDLLDECIIIKNALKGE